MILQHSLISPDLRINTKFKLLQDFQWRQAHWKRDCVTYLTHFLQLFNTGITRGYTELPWLNFKYSSTLELQYQCTNSLVLFWWPCSIPECMSVDTMIAYQLFFGCSEQANSAILFLICLLSVGVRILSVHLYKHTLLLIYKLYWCSINTLITGRKG